jgi:hypothetical protein
VTSPPPLINFQIKPPHPPQYLSGEKLYQNWFPFTQSNPQSYYSINFFNGLEIKPNKTLVKNWPESNQYSSKIRDPIHHLIFPSSFPFLIYQVKNRALNLPSQEAEGILIYQVKNW